MNLVKNAKLTLVKAAQSAGTTAVNSDGVDMQGFSGVVFFGSIATQASGNKANAAQGADNSSDWQDLAGTSVTTSSDGNSFMIDIYKPTDRYVRCEIARGTSTATGDIYALQYHARNVPTSQGSTIDEEVHASPAEGTA